MSDEVVIYNDEARIGTFLIAKGLERPHDHVRKLIEKYREDFEDFGFLPTKKLKSTGGRPANEFLLNYEQFIFIVSLLRNNKNVVSATSQVIRAGTLMAALQLLKNFDFGESKQRFVYAAVDEQKRVKIGISNNPIKRIKQLNIGNAENLKLIFTKKALGKGYSDEIKLHEKYKQFRIRSEWFESKILENINEKN